MTFARILRDYNAASGQKVNLSKLGIYFSPKTKPQLNQVIKECLGIAEQAGVW